jgi:uncharacterized protein YidB (DUF937 family)
MGLVDTVLGQQTAEQGEGGLMNSVVHVLGSHDGGLQGLLQSFESQGLGHIISSWIGIGPNKPISPDQVEQGLGSERISQIADHSGMPVEDVKSRLAGLLPNIVDKLTPNGQMPEGGLLQQGLNFLKTRGAV